MAQSNQSVLYDINLKYTCIMVESHRAQQYMMVSFNFDLSKIGFLHYIRNVVRHKILGLGKTRPGYMYIERNTNIAILQIRYGYLHRIVFLNLVSNRGPGKCGFEKIKRANP